MSFLDNIKANKMGSGVKSTVGGNPFATSAGVKPAAAPGNPFANKTAAAPTTVKPAAPAGVKPSAPTAPTRPAAPSFVAPKAPTMQKPAAPVAPTAPAEENVTPKEVTTEELVKDVKATKIEEPVATPIVEEVKEAKVEVPAVEENKEEEKPKAKATKKASTRKRNTTAKAKEETPVDTVSNEEAETIERLFKMPTTAMTYAEAVKAIKNNNFVDEEWETFRASLIEQADDIKIESDMQEGAVKKTLAQLNDLRDKIWIAFNDTKTILEGISSKDNEGLIERVKFVNLEGNNETNRKKAAVLAVMNYVTPEGDKINLYEVYDETKARLNFLKSLMDTIDYKSRILVTTLGAIKAQKNMY